MNDTTFVTLANTVTHPSGCFQVKAGERVELWDVAPLKPFVKRNFYLRDSSGVIFPVTKEAFEVNRT